MVQKLDGVIFSNALRAGYLAVVGQEPFLNRINVYPVPDGDTGYNMATTLQAATHPLGHQETPTLGRAARVAADAALDGARGNSGAIFAQFLQGFAAEVGDLVRIDQKEFSQASAMGTEAAYRAIRKPQEGTILSVIRAWSRSVSESADTASDFYDLFVRALEVAKDALQKTPEQLDVLVRAGVVDAGGQGFVTFLEGATQYLQDGHIPSWSSRTTPKPNSVFGVAASESFDSAYRYCTEALLSGDGLDGDSIAPSVEHLGDSLVVAGSDKRLRLHIHTNTPRLFFEQVAHLGFIEQCKIDDMWIQHSLREHASIAVLTDSTCDLPEQGQSRADIYSVPLNIRLEREEFADGRDLVPAAFYQRMCKSHTLPKTSQPSAGEFANLYNALLRHYDSIVSIHIAGAISGTVEAARKAADSISPTRIQIIDSQKVSVGLGFVVEAAAKAIGQGATLSEVVQEAQHMPERIRIFGTVPSLEHAVLGGRIDARVAWCLEALGIKPIIEFDSQGKPFKAGVKLGFGRALSALVNRAKDFAGDDEVQIRVVHANAPLAGQILSNKVMKNLQLSDVPVLQAGAVLGTHVGCGAVALAVLR